ncbi:MAG: phage tail tape measure protein [Rhizobiaceae bacterium]|nr:phage tail tape measure protein [Rhizobiaceae bacterium]MCZ8349847.1 phage tail tape measure protein [Rhizobium sp.]
MAGSTITSSLVVRLIDQVTGPAKKVSGALLGLNQTARGATAGIGDRLSAAIDQNNAALDRARMGLVDAAAGLYALKTAFSSPIREAMAFESAMADVRKVVDFPTPKGFDEFRDGLLDLSKRLPVSVNGLAEIAAAAGQAGIAGDDLNKFTEAAAKVGVAFDIGAGEAGDALAKLKTGLGLTIDETVLLTDAMNHLSNAQASSAAEVLDVVRRVGAQGAQFGFTAEQVAALGSAMVAAGAESDVAATSIRNMGLALTKGESATKSQRKAFKALGLDAAKVAKRMQEDAVGTTLDVMERISKLPKETQAAISSELFGNEARALGPLLTNLGLLKDSFALVADEAKYSGSSFKEYEVRSKTFANSVAIFQNRLSALKITIGSALIPALNDLLDKVAPIVDRITDFAEKNPELVRSIVAVTASLVALKVATAGLTFIGLLGRGGALSALSLGFNTAGRAAGVAAGAFRRIRDTIGVRNALGAAALGRSLTSFEKLGTVFLTLGGAGARLVWTLTKLTVVGALIGGTATWIWNNWQNLSNFFSGFADGFMKNFQPIGPVLQPIVKGFGDLFGFVSNLLGPIQDTDGAFRSWGETVGGAVAQGVNVVVSAIERLVGLLTTAYEKAVAFGSAISNALSFGDNMSGTGVGGGKSARPATSGHRASGGPVWGGSSYLVGEKGPEIFTPGRSGTITPNAGASPSLGSVQIGPFHISGSTDPEEAARTVARHVNEELSRLLRGSHSDMGAR